ncbi:MAG: ankyrin repeat domain-containing protein [Planctomycetota bacterium]|nr:ankyrin repeat domain-containing protein [Planctomycetota bacterium]
MSTKVISHARIPVLIVLASLAVLGVILWRQVATLPTDRGPEMTLEPSIQGSLHEAAEKGDVPSIRRAAQSGNVDTHLAEGPRKGMTPLMAAALAGKSVAVDELLKAGANVEARDAIGRSPLMYAALSGDAPTVRRLLEANARVDARDPDNWTPPLLAAYRGNVDALRLLIEFGANVNNKNKWGQTALMAAARSGDQATAEVVLAAKPDVNDQDETGDTALSLAAQTDTGYALIERLLAAGANVNIANEDGVTPLMRAADRGDKRLLVLLLERGAKARVKDDTGRDAAAWAKARDDEPGQVIARLLESAAE